MAVGGASDDPARRIVRTRLGRRPQAGHGQRGLTGPERVVIMGPDGDPPTRCHTLQIVRGGPAAPAVAVPAMALQPRIAGQGDMRGAHTLQPIRERGRGRQVHLRRRHRGLGQVEVRVGQPGDRDLVRLQADPLREGVRARLQVHLRARERDAAVADPDRLYPAESVRARERGDPAADQRVEWHTPVRVAGRPGAPPARRGPCPHPRHRPGPPAP